MYSKSIKVLSKKYVVINTAFYQLNIYYNTQCDYEIKPPIINEKILEQINLIVIIFS